MGEVLKADQSKVKRGNYISAVKPLHREVARRLILGQKVREISLELGVSEAGLRTMIKSPLFKLELKRLSDLRDEGLKDVTKTLSDLAPVALETIERTMYKTKSDAIRLKAAETLLDRAGFGSINKSLLNISGSLTHHHNLSKNELKRLVLERINRIEREVSEERAALKEAEAIEVELDEEESGPELPKDKPIKMMIGN